MTERPRQVKQDYGIILLRVSDFDQATLPEQLVLTKKRAEIMGVPIPEDGVYIDRGDSRSQYLTRESLQASLKRATDPFCKYVFVWQFTRMIGSIEQYLDITKQLRRCEVSLVDSDGTVHNAPDHNSKLTGIISAWQSEGEVILLRKRVRDTHAVKAEAGRLIGRPPYGIKVMPVLALPCKGQDCVNGGRGCEIPHSAEVSKKNGTVWITDDEHMANVRLMYQWAAEGVTMYQIERRLMELGIRSPEKPIKRGRSAGQLQGGAHFTRDNIRRLLQNRFYMGEVEWGRKRIVRDGDDSKVVVTVDKDEWIVRPHSLGPIVDVGIWEEAQKQIDVRLNKWVKGRRYDLRLLDGMVQCGRCGRPMQSRRRAGKRSRDMVFDYHCGGKYEVYSTCTTHHAIAESWLISELTGDPSGFVMRSRTPRIEVSFSIEADSDTVGPELATLEERAGQLRADAAQIEKMTIAGFYDIAEGIAKKQENKADLARVMARRDELLAAPKGATTTKEAPAAVAGLLALLSNERLPMEERRLALSRLVARVVVDRPSIRFVLREEGVEQGLEAKPLLRGA